MSADIVISYSSQDREPVMTLVERLRAAGASVWVDFGGIDGALLWGQEIVEAIEACKVLIFMASKTSIVSQNVVKEITLASEGNKPILPLHLEQIDIPKSMKWHLAGIQHIEMFRGDAESNFRGIARSLTRLGINIATSPIQTGQWQSRLIKKHSDSIYSVAFSPTEQIIATAGGDQTVELTDVRSGETKRTLSHDAGVAKVVFSNDGSTLASLEKESRHVQLWRTLDEHAHRTITTDFAVISIAFSADGKTLITSGDDYKVRFWNAETGEAKSEFHHDFRAVSLAVSSDGKMLACGCYKEVVVWDLTARTVISSLTHEANVSSVAFSPDNKCVAIGTWEHIVRLWSFDSGPLATLKSESKVLPLSFSADGQTLVGGGWDGSIQVWNPMTGQSTGVFSEHSRLVSSVSFSSDNTQFASGSWDGTVRVWSRH